MTGHRDIHPPVIAQWLLRLTLPARDRQVALGDLCEEFVRKLHAGEAPTYARRWYWRQAIRSIWPNIRRRLLLPLSLTTPTWRDLTMTSFLHDLRYAVRSSFRQPAYSLTILAMLSLGIAGNTAIFAVFNGLFLRPLPFADPDRLVNLDETAPQWNLEYTSINYQDFVNWRDHNTTFESMAVFRRSVYNLSGEGDPIRVSGASVSHDMAAVLGLMPVLGRHFRAEEDVLDGPHVIQLSYGLWRDRYGGDQNILGRSIRLDGEPYTVVGVLPPTATFIEDASYWIPLQTDVSVRTGSWWLDGIGRLRPGVTIEQAREDLTRIHKNAIETRSVNEVTSPVVLPILDRILGQYRLGTTAMLGAVVLVLLIACANIAGLMLARALARRQEIAIRLALGAGQWRVTRQLLTESLVLAAIGSAVGTTLGVAGSSGLRAMTSDALPAWVTFALDARVVGFAVAMTIVSVLLFGLLPALQASRAGGIVENATNRMTGGRGKHIALNALVAGEIALATVLLVAAGLAIRDFRALQRIDPGFTPDNVLSYRISLPSAEYEGPQRVDFFDRHLEQVRGLPGVVAAGAATNPPLSYHQGSFFDVEDAPPLPDHSQHPVTLVRVATPGYLEAIGITMLSGRTFAQGDGADPDAPVAVVNETFARRYWPAGQAIDKRIRTGSESNWIRIIGVARDVKHYGVDTEMRQGLYLPHAPNHPFSMGFIVRTATDPLTLTAPIRAVLRQADPNVPMSGVTTMTEALSQSLWARRAASRLALIFAAVALAMAIGGIYGVVSYTVGQRTKEIGIRMALGARPGRELSRVLGRGVGIAAIGIALGVAGALGTGTWMSSLLLDVSAVDPLVYGGVILLLFVVAMAANLVPARRAANLHPADILRTE